MEEPKLTKIHEDSRGEMYQILLPNGQEIMLLHSVEGSLRGGHSHTADEVVVLVSGHLEYHKGQHGSPLDIAAGQPVINFEGVPHYGKFLSDSWLLEFKYGDNSRVGEWENVDDEPMRAIVWEASQ